MRKSCGFFNVTRRLLRKRLSLVKQGITPQFTDIRHFFYECRNVFLRENLDLTEVDSTSKTLYVDFEGQIIKFCHKHCNDFNIPEELYWRLREMMNIWAEPKAVCEGDNTKFLIDRDTRTEVGKNCSFILVCEKKTVSKELLEELGKRGYKVQLVSSGGQSVSDAHEALIEAIKDIEKEAPNFYILVLHDYDLSGVTIYYNLQDRVASVIDVGVNRDFFKQLPIVEWRLVEERRQNGKYSSKLKDRIQNDTTGIYTSEDFEYLQGKQTFVMNAKGREKKVWKAHRIEIDAIHVQYGITPFVDYIEKRIQEECKYWDLTRIGVNEFELEEPDNPFNNALVNLNRDVSEKCSEALQRINKPIQGVQKFIEGVTSDFFKTYLELRTKNGIQYVSDSTYGDIGVYELKRKDLDALLEKYETGFDREYALEFDDELEELNKRVHYFDGDITRAEELIKSEFSELQTSVEDYAENDEEAEEFNDELSWIDWGEDEFNSLKTPDEREVIKKVIEGLKQRLDEIESGGKSNNA